MKYILAIDQGTTSSRAILYDKQGKVAASAQHEFPQYFPKPGWVEHDPEEIWESVNRSIQKVLPLVPHGSIAAIGITNQRETTVLWDKETGEPLYNAIVWQCRRTSDRALALRKNKAKVDFIRKRTGLQVDAYFSAPKIEWIFKHVRGALSKAKKGKVLFGTTDSWILWKLTGGKVHATDYTNASRTMIYNIHRLKWDHKLVKLFSIPYSILPKVQASSSVFGRTVKIGHLPAFIPITGIAGDQQAALFGQMCTEPGSMKTTYGTGSFMLLNTGKKCYTSKAGLVSTIACGPKGEPVYALEGSVFIAGAAIQWLRDQLNILQTAPESEESAGRVADTGGVYFVPAFVGLGAPYWDQHVRGAIMGITRGTNRHHIVRAALEALGYQTRDILAAMKKDTGLTVKTLRVDGGAVANSLLCQMIADITGIPVVRPKHIEVTSRGAAYLAGLSIGFWKSSNEIKTIGEGDRFFAVSLKREKADALYAGWKKAVEGLIHKG